MDWTQITLAGIAFLTMLVTSILVPWLNNRSHKKTRGVLTIGSEGINTRIDSIEISMKDLCKQVHETTITTQGLHLLDVIEHRPQCWETIRQAFAAYQAAGGNGHVQRVVEQWEHDFGQYLDRGEVPPKLMKKIKNDA